MSIELKTIIISCILYSLSHVIGVKADTKEVAVARQFFCLGAMAAACVIGVIRLMEGEYGSF